MRQRSGPAVQDSCSHERWLVAVEDVMCRAACAWPEAAGRAAVLTVLLLEGCLGTACMSSGSLADKGCELPRASQELAAEFRRLRGVQGYFQGASWTADVDAWMGRKHQVMIELGSLLGGGGCARSQVTDLLGPPDVIAGPGDALFDQLSGQPEFAQPPGEPDELLIYCWRGEHDYLYFVLDGQAIVGSGWWHAYE